jgi:sulfonate transport system ATP-binding protein
MLTLNSVSKTYADGTEALRDIKLDIEQGEIVALVGGSGCGKTTLMRLISGLDTASAGSIAVDGDIITAPHPAVGVVFQEPRLLPWLSVADNIAFGLHHLPQADRIQAAEAALERVGLAGYGARWPRELSGGQQQRVSIARALVPKPKVLLLDEPFSALDAFTRASLHEHLLTLWDANRPTVVIVTHDVDEAIRLADRVVVMRPKPGRIFEVVSVAAPRPRDPLGLPYEKAKRRVLNALDRSLQNELKPKSPTPQSGDAALWW